MRLLFRFTPALALALAAAGCGAKTADVGPTVDAFVGRLVQQSKPVSFPSGENVSLQLFHEKGQSFGIPIKSDGSFTIGWMPIGKYSAMLKREKAGGARTGPNVYNVPGGLTIEQGRTEYSVELGNGWKP